MLNNEVDEIPLQFINLGLCMVHSFQPVESIQLKS